jgi:hypothetical protein
MDRRRLDDPGPAALDPPPGQASPASRILRPQGLFGNSTDETPSKRDGRHEDHTGTAEAMKPIRGGQEEKPSIARRSGV